MNLGVRFDSEEGHRRLGECHFRSPGPQPFEAGIYRACRGGKTSFARLDYAIERNPLRNLNLAYQFTYQDLDIYKKGDKTFNTSYTHHFAEFGYSDMNWLNFFLSSSWDCVMNIMIIIPFSIPVIITNTR